MAVDTRAWARVRHEGGSCEGAADRHLSAELLEQGLAEASVSFVEHWGAVEALVIRPPGGGRKQPIQASISVDGGLIGDRWVEGKAAPGDQISVMNLDVAAVIANGQSIVLFGDNIFTRLDLRDSILPVGTQLHLGGALVEVSAMPHPPCGQFRDRFGAAAFSHAAKDYRVIGIYMTVLQGGDVAIGDPFVRA